MEEWSCFHSIISLLRTIFGMMVSADKYIFLYSSKVEDQNLRDQIVALFPFKMNSIQNGFKYLGFFLNPNGYCKHNWC